MKNQEGNIERSLVQARQTEANLPVRHILPETPVSAVKRDYAGMLEYWQMVRRHQGMVDPVRRDSPPVTRPRVGVQRPGVGAGELVGVIAGVGHPGRAERIESGRDQHVVGQHPQFVGHDLRDGSLVATARRIYEKHEFQFLPLLGDVLQEAGCSDEDVLAHCRSPGPHVKGCWVVDVVLGRS